MRELHECKLKCKLPALVESLIDSVFATPKINHIDKPDLPSRKVLLEIIDDLHSILFPGYVRHDLCHSNLRYFLGDKLDRLFARLRDQITKALLHEEHINTDEAGTKGEEIALGFLEKLPEIRALCQSDAEAAFDGDPAAKDYTEVIFAYPGFYAIATYRLAHALHELDTPLIPRFLTEMAHHRTGIDIHPGATIGERFFIDHGTGVVIGETTGIGNSVQIYHGVTLGAFSPRKGQDIRGIKRHPTIESNVTIYPNATILGGETVVGAGSVIGGNVWLTRSVPPGSKVQMEVPAPKILPKESE